jgi:hypothetical protein
MSDVATFANMTTWGCCLFQSAPSEQSGSPGPAPQTAPAKTFLQNIPRDCFSKAQNMVGPPYRLLPSNTVACVHRKLGEPEGLNPLRVGLGMEFDRRPAQMF